MREIRLSGSVRGVRRNPYPYRDSLYPLQSSVPFVFSYTEADDADRRSSLRYCAGED